MKRIRTCIIGIILTMVSSTNALPIGANSEPNLSEVLNHIYGVANWIPYNAPDELWICFNGGHASAEARFAAYTQDFGYLPDVTVVAFNFLFNVNTSGYLNSNPLASFTITQTGSIFRFADKPSESPLWSSQVNDNSDFMDHMQTYFITGGPSAGNYAIAWEDLPDLGDADYQDLVVEVSGVQPVPEPATVLLLGLGALSLRKKRRKKRTQTF